MWMKEEEALIDKIVKSNLYEMPPAKWKTTDKYPRLLRLMWCLKYAEKYGTVFNKEAAKALDDNTDIDGYAMSGGVKGLTMGEISRLSEARFGSREKAQDGTKQTITFCRWGLLRRLPSTKTQKRPCTNSPKNEIAFVIYLPTQISDADFNAWIKEDKVDAEDDCKAKGYKSSYWLGVEKTLAVKNEQINVLKDLFIKASDGRLNEIYREYATDKLNFNFVRETAIRKMIEMLPRLFAGESKEAVVNALCSEYRAELQKEWEKNEAERARLKKLEESGTTKADI